MGLFERTSRAVAGVGGDQSALAGQTSHQRRGRQYAGIFQRLLMQGGPTDGAAPRQALQSLVRPYSQRKAVIGSTLAARRAGK